jgi:hypothetical protein
MHVTVAAENKMDACDSCNRKKSMHVTVTFRKEKVANVSSTVYYICG